VRWFQSPELTPQPVVGIRLFVDVHNMSVQIKAVEGMRDERARLTLTGSGWTTERVQAAGEALRTHLADH
ncbi:hypothetical protein AB4Z54_31020, partial [Streptomyces sp. MCAF7]